MKEFIADPEFAFDMLVAATEGSLAMRVAIVRLRSVAKSWLQANSLERAPPPPYLQHDPTSTTTTTTTTISRAQG